MRLRQPRRNHQSLRLLPEDQRLSVRPYAMLAHLPAEIQKNEERPEGDGAQASLFGAGAERQVQLSLARKSSKVSLLPDGYLLPANGKFFKRFSVADRARLQDAERAWEQNKVTLPYPKSEIPVGFNTNQMLKHHYRHWHEMFAPRQLLALSTLLQGIMAESDRRLQETLLCTFSDCVGRNNFFCRYFNDRNTIQEIFSRHDYQPKITLAEGSVFGDSTVRGTFPQMLSRTVEGKEYAQAAFDWKRGKGDKPEKVFQDSITFSDQAQLACGDSSQQDLAAVPPRCVVTDPPYVGNVNYSELSDFFYVWLRLVLKTRYSFFAPEYTEKLAEIVENVTRGKSRQDFYEGLTKVFKRAHDALSKDGLLIFTFHHADQDGTVWEGLLQSLCDTGYELAAVYPVHAESESSLQLQNKENISYDLIHVCRKRQVDPAPRSWAGVRQEVRRRARTELAAIEAGRYGGKPLAEPDVRLVCIGKCLELYSAHYDRVLDHEGKTLPLHRALQDISTIVDQLVTRDRPLPAELENIDSLSYVWLRCLMPRRAELSVDSLSKDLRALQVSIGDVKDAGLVIRGRDGKASGRSRSYEIKQPAERLEQALANLERVAARQVQTNLFDTGGQPDGLIFADLWQALVALADAGESVLPLLEQFRAQWPEIAAGLRYCKLARNDWEPAILRVIGVMEGAPLLVQHGVA